MSHKNGTSWAKSRRVIHGACKSVDPRGLCDRSRKNEKYDIVICEVSPIQPNGSIPFCVG